MVARLRAAQPGASLPSILFYRAVAIFCHVVGVVFFGLRAVHVKRVPASGPLLLAANHQSYLDPPFIGCLIYARNLDYIARVGLFTFKPLGWLITALNSIPIRGTGAADTGSIREVVARLQTGRATLIFPEGSRTEDGQLQSFQQGMMLLVRKAKCPVLPVAISGAYEAWPRSRPIPVPWKARVIVRYGDPIPAETLLALTPEEAMQLLRSRIEALLAER